MRMWEMGRPVETGCGLEGSGMEKSLGKMTVRKSPGTEVGAGVQVVDMTQ